MRSLKLAWMAPLVFSLACSGIWREATSESFSEMTARMMVTIPAGPQRDQVLAVLDEGFVQTRQGEVGIFQITSFEEMFDAAIADGQLTEIEVKGLEAAGATNHFPVVSPATLTDAERQHRENLLAIKRAQDEQMGNDPFVTGFGRVDTGSVDGFVEARSASFAGLRSTELRARLESAGWAFESCSEDRMDAEEWTTCSAQKDGRYATVMIVAYADQAQAEMSSMHHPDEATASRRDGKEVLTVIVLDSGRSASLRDGLVPTGAALSELTRTQVERRLHGDGWTLDYCESSMDTDGSGFSCEMLAGDVRGSIDVWTEADPEYVTPGEQRHADYGSASVTQGGGTLIVELIDGGAAEVLAETLLSR